MQLLVFYVRIGPNEAINEEYTFDNIDMKRGTKCKCCDGNVSGCNDASKCHKCWYELVKLFALLVTLICYLCSLCAPIFLFYCW